MIVDILRFYFKLILRMYYREIKVEGIEHISEDKPMLLVSNHPNALVDALILLTEIDRNLVLTATSMLNKFPFLSSMIKRANIVLFHRRMDGHSEEILRKNQYSMERCAEIMHEGNKLLLFPEGKSSENGKLLAFKTGAVRIAKTYVEKTGEDLPIVPIYLHYSNRDKIRSKVSIKFHEPISTKRGIENHQDEYVSEFTEEIKQVLETTEMERYLNSEATRSRELKLLDKFLIAPFVAFHIIPTSIIFIISNLATDREDAYSTIRVFSSVIIFPIFYIIELIFLISFLPLMWVAFLLIYLVIFLYQGFNSFVLNIQDGPKITS